MLDKLTAQGPDAGLMFIFSNAVYVSSADLSQFEGFSLRSKGPRRKQRKGIETAGCSEWVDPFEMSGIFRPLSVRSKGAA